VSQPKGRELVGAQNAVVHEGAGRYLTARRIERNTFAQRLAQPLSDSAMRLSFDDHRVNRAADVVHRRVAHDPHGAGNGIDFDFAHRGARRKRGNAPVEILVRRERLAHVRGKGS